MPTSSSEALTALSCFATVAGAALPSPGKQTSSSDAEDEHLKSELTSRSVAEATSSSSEIEPLVDTDTMPGANQKRKASTYHPCNGNFRQLSYHDMREGCQDLHWHVAPAGAAGAEWPC